MAVATSTITLSVTRYDPEADTTLRRQAYTIPYREDMVVLDALNYIKSHIDGTLTFRWSCRMGICGSCGMMVNGTPRLTCGTFLREFYPNAVVVEPLANFPVIRDLVIDMDDFLHKLGEVQPWIMRAGHDRQTSRNGATEDDEQAGPAGDAVFVPYRQTPAQLEEFRQFSMCINCMLCYAACPVYAIEKEFIGPAAIALGRRYNLDSRDEGKATRLDVIASSAGIWDCTYVGECTTVCPKGVDPAKAIQQTKWDTTLEWVKAMVLPWGKK